MVTPYEQVTDGETFLIETDQPLLLACCSCGLIHEFLFNKVRRGVQITLNRKGRIKVKRRTSKP